MSLESCIDPPCATDPLNDIVVGIGDLEHVKDGLLLLVGATHIVDHLEHALWFKSPVQQQPFGTVCMRVDIPDFGIHVGNEDLQTGGFVLPLVHDLELLLASV